MKIKFNPDLDFQADAIASIADLFEGQETCQTNFTVDSLERMPQTSRLRPRMPTRE